MMRSALGATLGLLWLAADARAADPPGADSCIDANEAAHRLQREGKLVAARASLLGAARGACPAPVRADSTQLLEDIDKALPTVVLAAKDGSGNDLPAVRVLVDGALLSERLDGTALAVDPGEHRFRFEAPGATPLEKTLVIHQGEKNRREVVTFGGAPPVAAAGSDASAPDWPGRRVAGVALGVTGVVALAVGAGFGALAIAKKNASFTACPDDPCSPDAVSVAHTGLIASYAATGLVIGGAALAVTGLALALVPGSAPVAARLEAWPGGLGVRGRW